MTASRPERLDDVRAAYDLGRFLDTGGHAAVSDNDTGLTLAARRINAVAAQAVPNDIVAAERRRIWEDIMATQHPPVTVTAPPIVPSRVHPDRVSAPPRHGQPAGRQWSSRLQFAVAAALILGLFASLASQGPPNGTGGPASNDLAAVAGLTTPSPYEVAAGAADHGDSPGASPSTPIVSSLTPHPTEIAVAVAPAPTVELAIATPAAELPDATGPTNMVIDLTFQVDADGLAAQDPAAIADAEATVREVLGPYADAGCRFGTMIVEGNSGAAGTIGEGNALSDTVVEMITTLYPEAADQPFTYTAANLSEPEGQIALQLLTYAGCTRPMTELAYGTPATEPTRPTGPLSQIPINLVIQVDADRLAARDLGAIAEVEARIREVFGPYADIGCVFGVLFIEGNSGPDGTIGEGNALSDMVAEVIVRLYPEAAGQAFQYTSANLSDPAGQVTLLLLPYEGCSSPVAATPAA